MLKIKKETDNAPQEIPEGRCRHNTTDCTIR